MNAKKLENNTTAAFTKLKGSSTASLSRMRNICEVASGETSAAQVPLVVKTSKNG